jgi:hypothetical protein
LRENKKLVLILALSCRFNRFPQTPMLRRRRVPRLAVVIALLVSVFQPVFLSAADEELPGTGLDFDLPSYRGTPYKATLTAASYAAVPPAATLRMYCPTPGDQGRYGTCVAFAVAYHARTILWGYENRVTDRARLDAAIFSPTFVYEQVKSKDDATCAKGSNPVNALELMKTLGTAPLSTVPYTCGGSITDSALLKALEFPITDYQTLFSADVVDRDVRVKSVKKSLAEGYPVVLGFTVAKSFYKPTGGIWRPQPTDAGATGQHGRHAMVVVGYDDNYQGGCFHILNSWGTKWGSGGYIWVPYADFADYALCAFQVYGPRPKPRPPAPPTPIPPTPDRVEPPAPPTKYLQGRVELALRDGTVMPAARTTADAKSAESFTAYRVRESHASGTRFRFFITTNTEAYLYAFATDLTGKVTRILPYEDGMSPLVGPDSTVAFPSETKVIRMDEQPGSDFLLILYTDKPLDSKAILAAMQGATGGLSGQIRKALGSRLIEPSDVKYSDNQIAFEVDSTAPGRVVPLMIEIPHH